MSRLSGFLRRQLFRLLPTDRVFQYIHRTNAWGDDQSISGPGSNPELTAAIRSELPQILERFHIRSLVDAPCGDAKWISTIKLPVDSYLGLDIVPELIITNQERIHRPNWVFSLADITKDPIPRADAILCRDALVHLSNNLARDAIRNFKASGATWLLATTFPATTINRDIPTGEWRPLNLELAPFHLPKPDYFLDEKCLSFQDGKWKDKGLGVWKLPSIS